MGQLYNKKIKTLLDLVFAHMNESEYTPEETTEVSDLTNEIAVVLDEFLSTYTQSNIVQFRSTLLNIRTMIDAEAMDYSVIKNQLSADTNIKVEAYYNQGGIYAYEEDQFMNHLNEIAFEDEDEAQRIKLITYYTFKSIPIQSNTTWRINYRIYAS